MTTFLKHNLYYLNKHKQDPNFTQNLLTAHNYFLSQDAQIPLHIIGCRLALYNFQKHPSKRRQFWQLYLQHKNGVFSN